MMLAVGAMLGARAETSGSCMNRAIPIGVGGSAEVTLVNEYDPEHGEYSGSGCCYYKVTLTKGSACTIWLSGGQTSSMGLDVDADWSDENAAFASFTHESRQNGSLQVAYLHSDDWDAEDPMSATYYIYIIGEIGDTCTLSTASGIRSFAVPGEEDAPIRITPSTDERVETRALIDGKFYFIANLQAGHAYMFRTTGGTSSVPLGLDIVGGGDDMVPIYSYSGDVGNMGFYIIPATTRDCAICVSARADAKEFELRYKSFPPRPIDEHPATELSSAGEYAAVVTPGRMINNTTYYDKVIDEALCRIYLPAGEKWSFETSGATNAIMMMVYDADGNVIGENRTLGKGSHDCRVVISTTYSGYYYVGVCRPEFEFEYWDTRPTEGMVTVRARRVDGIGLPDRYDAGDDTYGGAEVIDAPIGSASCPVEDIGSASGTHGLNARDWYDYFAVVCSNGMTYALKATFATSDTTNLGLEAKVYKIVNGAPIEVSRTPDLAQPFVFTADTNAIYYVRVSVADGVGLDYPLYRIHAAAYVKKLVILDANGGTLKTAACTRQVFSGATMGALPTPKWSGHVFDGWYTERDGGKPVDEYAIVESDMRIYAHWQERLLSAGKWYGSEASFAETVDFDEIRSCAASNNLPLVVLLGDVPCSRCGRLEKILDKSTPGGVLANAMCYDGYFTSQNELMAHPGYQMAKQIKGENLSWTIFLCIWEKPDGTTFIGVRNYTEVGVTISSSEQVEQIVEEILRDADMTELPFPGVTTWKFYEEADDEEGLNLAAWEDRNAADVPFWIGAGVNMAIPVEGDISAGDVALVAGTYSGYGTPQVVSDEWMFAKHYTALKTAIGYDPYEDDEYDQGAYGPVFEDDVRGRNYSLSMDIWPQKRVVSGRKWILLEMGGRPTRGCKTFYVGLKGRDDVGYSRFRIYATPDQGVSQRPSDWSGQRELAVLPMPIGGGTTSGSGMYASGTRVSLSATPSAGYEFEGWYDRESGRLLGSSTSLSHVTTGADEVVFAKFRVGSSIVAGSCADAAIPFVFVPSVATYPVTLTKAWLADEGRYDDASGVLYCKSSVARGKVYTIALPAGQEFEVSCGASAGIVNYVTIGGLRYCLVDARDLSVGTADILLGIRGGVDTRTTVYVVEGDYLAKRLLFDPNGGTCPVASKEVRAGVPIGELPTPAFPLHVFQGWFTAREGGARVTAAAAMVGYDVTLYAHWEAVAAGSCLEKAIAFPFGPSVAAYPVNLAEAWLADEERYDASSGVLYCKSSVVRGKVYTLALPVGQGFEVACADAGTIIEYAAYGSLRYCRVDARGLVSGAAEIALALYGEAGAKTTVYVVEGDLVPADADYEAPPAGSCPGKATAFTFGAAVQARTVRLFREWDEIGERYLAGGVHYLTATAPTSGRLTVAVPTAQVGGLEVLLNGLVQASRETCAGFSVCIFDAQVGDEVLVRLSGARGADAALYAYGGDYLARRLLFDPNGGTCPVASKDVRAGSPIGELPVPDDRAGYAFQGWFTAREGGARVTAATTMVGYDVTLYAHWEAVAAGSCLEKAIAFPFGPSVAAYPVNLAKEWLADEGRYDASSGVLYCKSSVARGKVYTIALPVGQGFEVACADAGAIIEYAAYGALRYCVVDARDLFVETAEIVLALYGEAGARTTVYVVEGNLVPAAAQYEDPDPGDLPGSCPGRATGLEFASGARVRTVRLVREWDEGGSRLLDGSVRYLRATAPFDGRLTVAVPALQADGCEVVCEGNAAAREDFGGLAFWIFDAQAGDEVLVALSGARGAEATVYTVGWDYLAKRLLFDPNGGSCPVASKSVRAGSPVGGLPTPDDRAGHAFLGWFTAREGGARVTAAVAMVGYDVTLYAHWEKLDAGSGQEAAIPFAMTTSVAAYPVSLSREWLEDERRHSDKWGALYCKTTLKRGRVYTMAVPKGLDEVNAWCVNGEASVTYGSDASLQYVRFDTTKMAAAETAAYFAVFGDAGQRTTIYAVEADLMP